MTGEAKQIAGCPFYHLVPKDRAGNAKFRQRLLQMAKADADDARKIVDMCRQDVLFFLNSFAILYEPRTKPPEVRPFITYPFQDEVIVGMRDAIGEKDVVLEKSRDMGASWMVLGLFVWHFVFHPHYSFMVMSRNEKLVDKRDNPDALFSKIDHLLKYLPGWLRPKIDRTELHIKNLDNGSVIDGTSTTGDAGRGGRRTAFMMDEFAAFDLQQGQEALAATQMNTQTRIFVSTITPIEGAFDEMCQRDDSNILKFKTHWSIHPEQRKGLYQSRNGVIEKLDPDYVYPEDYQFIADGRLRSPYYDRECARAGNNMDRIARELDIERAAAGSRMFDPKMLDRLQDQVDGTCRPPSERIEMKELLEGSESILTDAFWKRCGDAKVDLWVQRDANGNVARDRLYFCGVDVATGTGASNSAVGVWDGKTRERVAGFAWPTIEPDELAAVVEKMVWLFSGHDQNHAKTIWENRGPGKQFGRRLEERGCINVYMRRNEFSISRKQTDTPGWEPTAQNKYSLLSNYATALKTDRAINHDAAALEDCRGYVYTKTGVDHLKSIQSDDPTGARDNHGDRAIADALAVHLMSEYRVAHPNEEEVYAWNSAAWRRQQHLKDQDQKANRERTWWSRSGKKSLVWGAK